MENTEVIKALRNCMNVNYEYQAEGTSCSKCPYKKINHCKRTMMRDAADALEMDEQRIVEQQKQIAKLYILLNNRINEIAELEEDKKTLINVVKDKSDFHTTRDAMRIAELEAQIPKESEWETTDNRWGCGKYRCPVCNNYEDEKRKYCPNCGTKMKFNDKQKTESKNIKSPLEYDYCGTPKRRYDIEAQDRRTNNE